MERLPRRPPVAHSVEACIGQKLQLIGDQFHREHLQLVRRRHILHTHLKEGHIGTAFQ